MKKINKLYELGKIVDGETVIKTIEFFQRKANQGKNSFSYPEFCDYLEAKSWLEVDFKILQFLKENEIIIEDSDPEEDEIYEIERTLEFLKENYELKYNWEESDNENYVDVKVAENSFENCEVYLNINFKILTNFEKEAYYKTKEDKFVEYRDSQLENDINTLQMTVDTLKYIKKEKSVRAPILENYSIHLDGISQRFKNII